MRIRTLLIGALLLAPAGLAQAQEPQQPTTNSAAAQTMATPASSFVPKRGQVDFGFRGESLSGDEARYNRFRDRREGAFLDGLKFEKETDTTFFRAEANNVGYRDQRYFGQFIGIGRVKATFEWNQIPLYLSSDSRSLYRDNGNGVLGIEDSVQATLQAATALGTAARDFAIQNALANSGIDTDLRSRRDIGLFDMTYSFNRDVDLKFLVRNTKRSGNQIMAFGFGTSPGLNPAVEIGMPLDDRTTDVKGVLEYSNAKAFFAVGYNGSWFDNSVQSVRFDNPLRATDISGGPSVGQASWWPTSTSFAMTANGSYKLAARTRASAALSVGRWSQDEPIIPFTVNSALVSPSLDRGTAQLEADITSMVFNLNSRPANNVWLNARYRFYNYDNKSPQFTATNAIIGDWAAGTQVHHSEPSSFKRNTVDLDASFTPHDYVSLGVGYGREDSDRTWRIFEKTAEDTFRVTFDSLGNQYVSLRAKYEVSSREGSGFDQHLLDEVGEQPEMRHFDIANRDRTRVSTSLVVTPTPFLSLNAGVGMGDDEYGDTGFGLRDNENRSWNAGFDLTPNDTVSFGASYGYEKLKANQYSRTALPAPNPQFNDPNRDWWIDSDDIVKTFNASLDLIKAFPKTDIRLGYDISDGKATYVYGASSLQTIFPTTQLQQLTPVKNRLTGGRMDVQYFVRANVALGVAYQYEEYEVDDFSLDTDTINRLDARNGTTGVFASTLYGGYLFRPYTAHTAWLKMTYLW